jgi:hypothetical protein
MERLRSVSRAKMEQILKGTGWHVTRYLESGDSTYVAIIEKTQTPDQNP